MSESSKPPKSNISNFLNKIRPRGASPGKTPPPLGAKVKRSRTPIRFTNLFSRFTSNSKSQASLDSQSEDSVAPHGSSEDGAFSPSSPSREESFNNMQEVLDLTFSSPSPGVRTVSAVDLRLVTTERGSMTSTSDLTAQPQQFSSLTDVSGEIQSTTPTGSPRQPSYLNISRALNGYGYRNCSPLNTPVGRSIVERRVEALRLNDVDSTPKSASVDRACPRLDALLILFLTPKLSVPLAFALSLYQTPQSCATSVVYPVRAATVDIQFRAWLA
uniref:Cytohesin 1 interacting protein n=1 Tax=Steinernema glaseri TaxID=37863 RepID=A0A1I7ZX36_9BILA